MPFIFGPSFSSSFNYKRRIDISQSNQSVIRSRPDRSPSIKKYFSYTLRLIVPKHTRSHGRSLAVWRVSLQQISLWVPIIFWAFLTVCRCLSYHVDLELSNESVSIPRRKYRVGVNFVGASRRVCHVLSVFTCLDGPTSKVHLSQYNETRVGSKMLGRVHVSLTGAFMKMFPWQFPSKSLMGRCIYEYSNR